MVLSWDGIRRKKVLSGGYILRCFEVKNIECAVEGVVMLTDEEMDKRVGRLNSRIIYLDVTWKNR